MLYLLQMLIIIQLKKIRESKALDDSSSDEDELENDSHIIETEVLEHS